MMEQRLDPTHARPDAHSGLRALHHQVAKGGLERALIALIDIRVSQINGCAFCLNMHAEEARREGLYQQQLDVIAGWRDAPLFSERERAALAWAEALTLVADTHVPDDVYAQARAVFSEAELLDLTLAIIEINGWNRMNIAFRIPPRLRTREHAEAGART